ncbi:MAG: hypothetical protein AAF367_04075 [Pseudomonadota bacterium]
MPTARAVAPLCPERRKFVNELLHHSFDKVGQTDAMRGANLMFSRRVSHSRDLKSATEPVRADAAIAALTFGHGIWSDTFVDETLIRLQVVNEPTKSPLTQSAPSHLISPQATAFRPVLFAT